MSIKEITGTQFNNGNGNNGKSSKCLTCLAAGDSVCDLTCTTTSVVSTRRRFISRAMVAIVLWAGVALIIFTVYLIFQLDFEQCQVCSFLIICRKEFLTCIHSGVGHKIYITHSRSEK